jgi:hypothetical protein
MYYNTLHASSPVNAISYITPAYHLHYPSRLAATLGPKSKRGPSKRQILACDVSETCQKIIDPVEPLALRTSAGLLVGVVR